MNSILHIYSIPHYCSRDGTRLFEDIRIYMYIVYPVIVSVCQSLLDCAFLIKYFILFKYECWVGHLFVPSWTRI